MRKNKLHAIIIIIAMSVGSFFLSNNNCKKNRGDLVMDNIEALHASAYEMNCDQKVDVACTIEVTLGPGEYLTGRSYGYLTIIF